MLVLEGQLLHLAVCLDGVDFIRCAHGVTLHDQAVATEGQRGVVCYIRCDQFHPASGGVVLLMLIEVDAIHLRGAVPYTREVDLTGIGAPQKGIHIGGECLADKLLLTCGSIHYAQTVPIGLVTIPCHALPSDVFPIGRVLRVGVVATHLRAVSCRLAEVGGGSAC